MDVSTEEEIMETNVVGEIIVKCDGLMAGYLDDEETTNQVIKMGWFWTGDLGYKDVDGFVFLKGRKKDIAIIGGKNVSLAEVDEILYLHPAITNATCINVPEEISGEKIVAFVTVDNTTPISEQEIINHCYKHLSSYKTPREAYVVSTFPLKGGGKILRAKVKEWYLEGKKQW